MNRVRYITATDNSVDGYPRVCQLQYDNLFIDEVKHLSESMASVLTWVGYQCDYTCKEEMVSKALSEHYQLMYH